MNTLEVGAKMLKVHHMPPEEQAKCQNVIDRLRASGKAAPFELPVPWEQFELPSYARDVKKPRDLRTIESKLKAGLYPHPKDFRDDFNQCWDNAILWNEDTSQISVMAKKLKYSFEALYSECNFTRDYERLREGKPSKKETREVLRNLLNQSSHDEAAWVIELIESRSFRSVSFSGLETLINLNTVSEEVVQTAIFYLKKQALQTPALEKDDEVYRPPGWDI